jgi:hypothetical protein
MKLPSELHPYSFGGGEKFSKYQKILWPDIFRPEDSNYFSNIKEIGEAGGLSAYELSGYNKLNGRDANREGPGGIKRGQRNYVFGNAPTGRMLHGIDPQGSNEAGQLQGKGFNIPNEGGGNIHNQSLSCPDISFFLSRQIGIVLAE